MTNVEKVQAQFMAEIEKKGIAHVLDWISSWYSELGHATLQDEIDRRLGPKPSQDLVGAFLLEQAISEGRRVQNKSTSQGANMIREGYLNAISLMLDRRWTGFAGRNQIQDIYEQATKAARAAAAAAAATAGAQAGAGNTDASEAV